MPLIHICARHSVEVLRPKTSHDRCTPAVFVSECRLDHHDILVSGGQHPLSVIGDIDAGYRRSQTRNRCFSHGERIGTV